MGLFAIAKLVTKSPIVKEAVGQAKGLAVEKGKEFVSDKVASMTSSNSAPTVPSTPTGSAIAGSDTPPATGANHVTNQETGKLDAKQTAEHIANNVAHSEETAALTAADQKLQQQRYGNNLAIKQSDDQLVDAMTRGKNFHDKASQAAGA